ncbi:MAG TPA: hypothetical protein VET65_03930 [Candidatus Limnocylindrales bacterium]|nr:hypothetical protein [Candidatus Limnocylindrales bacterium]
MDEPIEWIGGQPEGARPKRWPYALLPLGLIGLVAASALSWTAIRSTGQAVAEAVVPYTVSVQGAWSSQDKVVGGPLSMMLTINNTDPRKLPGMTLRLKGLHPGWQIIGAGPSAQITGDAIYFSSLVAPGKSEDLTVNLMPVKAGDSQIQLTLSAGRSTNAITMKTSATSQGTLLNAPASVRAATSSDLAVTPQLLYVRDLSLNTDASWDVQVQNAGVIRITSVTVAFPGLPSSFELTTTNPAAKIDPTAGTVRFATALDPGAGETLTVHFTPHAAGTFHVAAQLYLSDEPDPIVLPNGDRAVNFDVTVS